MRGRTVLKISFNEFTIGIIDDPGFNPRSSNNLVNYDRVYYDEIQYQATSKHGIKVTKSGQSVSSAIVCETGGATGIHERSFIVRNDNLLLCCCDTVYAFRLPGLTLNWKQEFDPATCFGIYTFKDDFIIHGELEVRRIDLDGNTRWRFSAGDIFVTQDGSDAIHLTDDRIELTDWNGDKYVLDEAGQVIA